MGTILVFRPKNPTGSLTKTDQEAALGLGPPEAPYGLFGQRRGLGGQACMLGFKRLIFLWSPSAF